MKRVAIRLGLFSFLLVVLVAFFWRDVAAIFFVYKAREFGNERPYLENIPQSYQLETKVFPEASEARFENLLLLIPFATETSSSSSEFFVTRGVGEEFILIFKDTGLANDFRKGGDSNNEIACRMLSSGSYGNICSSNYLFWENMLNTTRADLGWFIQREDKVANSVVYILKSVIVTPGEMDFFETPEIKGFRIRQDDKKQTAIVFADNTQYTITTNIDQDQFDFVLRNIKYLP